MEPLRSWTIPGETPLTITVHRPAVTLRYGEGPEVELNPKQVSALGSKMLDAEGYFDTEDAEILA